MCSFEIILNFKLFLEVLQISINMFVLNKININIEVKLFPKYSLHFTLPIEIDVYYN